MLLRLLQQVGDHHQAKFSHSKVYLPLVKVGIANTNF